MHIKTIIYYMMFLLLCDVIFTIISFLFQNVFTDIIFEIKTINAIFLIQSSFNINILLNIIYNLHKNIEINKNNIINIHIVNTFLFTLIVIFSFIKLVFFDNKNKNINNYICIYISSGLITFVLHICKKIINNHYIYFINETHNIQNTTFTNIHNTLHNAV